MRTTVVTGGGTGIGRAVADRLAVHGGRVVIVGRREDVLVRTAQDLNERHEHTLVEHVTADLADPSQVEEAAARITAEHGVDVLVNNAGGNVSREPDRSSLAAVADGYLANFTANVMTSVLTTEALLPAMARPGGRIVMITSIAGLRGSGSYGVAKAAMHGQVWDLARRLAGDGITVNAVAPGFVPDTEFWDGRRDAETVRRRTESIPLGRPGTPSEVAEAVGYLAGTEGGWTTGQVLQVNGGDLYGRG